MKKIGLVLAVACLVLTLSFSATLQAKETKWKKPKFAHRSTVTGVIQCTDGEPVIRALVYLVGESFMAKTGDEGEFTLHAVPPGTYDLEIETADGIYAPESVEVMMMRQIDLGIIPIECVEASPESSISCQSDTDCSAGEYCDTSSGVGSCVVDAPCPDVYDPVCGSDWNTYLSPCLAGKAGVSIQYNGWCNAY